MTAFPEVEELAPMDESDDIVSFELMLMALADHSRAKRVSMVPQRAVKLEIPVVVKETGRRYTGVVLGLCSVKRTQGCHGG